MTISVAASMRAADSAGASATSTYASAYASYSDGSILYVAASIHNNAEQRHFDNDYGTHSVAASVSASDFTSPAVKSYAYAQKNGVEVAFQVWE